MNEFLTIILNQIAYEMARAREVVLLEMSYGCYISNHKELTRYALLGEGGLLTSFLGIPVKVDVDAIHDYWYKITCEVHDK